MGNFLRISNGVPRSFAESATPAIYDETYTAVGTVTAGTAITLPNSGSYNSTELEVYFNGQLLAVVDDFNYVGSPTRTQITLTFDLLNGEKIRFLKLRNF
jgi:hypothetical protein